MQYEILNKYDLRPGTGTHLGLYPKINKNSSKGKQISTDYKWLCGWQISVCFKNLFKTQNMIKNLINIFIFLKASLKITVLGASKHCVHYFCVSQQLVNPKKKILELPSGGGARLRNKYTICTPSSKWPLNRR